MPELDENGRAIESKVVKLLAGDKVTVSAVANAGLNIHLTFNETMSGDDMTVLMDPAILHEIEQASAAVLVNAMYNRHIDDGASRAEALTKSMTELVDEVNKLLGSKEVDDEVRP